MTYIGLRAIKIASLAKLARHVGGDETEINRALSKTSEKAAAYLASIIVETRGALTYKGAHAMINTVIAAAAGRDAEVITKRKADELAIARADRQAGRQGGGVPGLHHRGDARRANLQGSSRHDQQRPRRRDRA